MDEPRSAFDKPLAADWIAQAEHFEQMAERFSGSPELSAKFLELAEEARDRAKLAQS